MEGPKLLNYYKKTEGTILDLKNGPGIAGQRPRGRGNKSKIRQMITANQKASAQQEKLSPE